MLYFWQHMEFTVTSHKGRSYKIEIPDGDSNQIIVDGKTLDVDVLKTRTGLHILQDGQGSSVDIVSTDKEKKSIVLRIRGKRYSFTVKDKYDELLEKLGMDRHASAAVSEIKAPMPGLVLDILVKEGENIQAEQPIIILEAMKMENVIKSPTDTTIKKVSVSKGDSVEKNQLLVEFS